MLEAVQHFVDTCENNGLFIIDRPTGDGKTHDALKFIEEHFPSSENRVFFYITPLIKNVNDAYEQLRDFFNKAGKSEYFDLYSIKIQGNAECVLENFASVEKDFDEKFRNLNSFRTLRESVHYLNGMKDKQNPLYLDSLKIIREVNEPTFRNDIINTLLKNKDYKDLSIFERIRYIKNNCPYLIKLYPSIESKNKKIFFMTTDKFYFGNSTIVENGYRFINNSITKGAIIFMDEIDSTKKSILDKQIEDSAQQKVDIFKLFRQINNSLQSTITPPKILNQLKDSTAKFKSEETLEKIKQKFRTDYDKYGLNKFFKYDSKDNDRSFLFNDFDVHTYSNKPGQSLLIEDDDEKKLNIIKPADGTQLGIPEKGIKLEECIQTIKGLISYFVTGIAIISRNYLEWYNKKGRQSQDDEIEVESAISTVLTSFDLDYSFKKLLVNMISNNYNKFQNTKPKSVVNTDFYEEGFRYYSFFDQIDHNETTNVNMVDLFDTPENFLWQLTSKALVVGLSATGTIETVTGNYDISYLKRKLGPNYYIATKEDQERMRLAFQDNQEKNKSKVYIHFIPEKNTEKQLIASNCVTDLLNCIFKGVEVKEQMLQKIQNAESNENNQQRFLKVMVAIKDFLLNTNSKAILVLTNRNAKADDSNLFSKEYIDQFVESINKEGMIVPQYSIVLLYGNNFDERKKTIGQIIKAKKKAIILSSYPSSGTGQNLQYEIEDEKGVTKSQDIDSIYVEKPTNMLVNSSNGLTEENLLKYIYQIEALSQVGDIANAEVNKAVCFGFKKYAGTQSEEYQIGSIYKTESINNHLVISLNQAIGRICRTRVKAYDVNIYADSEILSYDFSCVKDKCLNKEFKAFADAIEKNQSIKGFDQDEKLMKENNRNCSITYGRINKILSSSYMSWTKEDMKQWEDMRKLVIENPTINEDKLKKLHNYYSLYIKALPNQKINRCYYSSNNRSVSFIKDKEHPFELSFESSHVNDLLKNEVVKEYYLEKNILLVLNRLIT